MSDKKFYVTTPIYYVNARPHIGHAYTTIVADVLARRHRLLGDDTFFLTGTDEHGQKIERSAAAAGIAPQQFADQVSKSFEDLWKRMGITNNDYIRTTSDKHKRGVQHLFSELYKNGFIYLASYTGSYCVSDEAFVDAPVGTPCPDCGRLLEEVTEENFFFKLSAFQRPLLDLIESDTIAITPDSRKNEVLSFLRGNIGGYVDQWIAEYYEKGGPRESFTSDQLGKIAYDELPRTSKGERYVPGALKDLSISRSSFTWGIPVPEPAASAAAQKHVIYVWLDALANYMTAIGYGSDDPAEQAKFSKYWPADLHLVGKEIIRFHCVYWPAFLLALNPAYNPDAVILSEGRSPQSKDPDAPSPATSANTFSTPDAPPQLTFDQHKAWAKEMLPQAITAHGWLLFEDSKMSKSKGNIVRTETILDAFGTLCPPSPATPSQNSVISTEAQRSGETPVFRSPQDQSVILSEAPSAPQETVILSEAQSAPQEIVILSEAKDLLSSAAPNNSPDSPDRKGTASAGPQEASHVLKGTGFSPSVMPTPSSLSSFAEGGGPASPDAPQLSPTQHDRDLFASDVLRYFLLREIPFGQDGSFSFDALITRYNADLANGYGNLVSRTLKLIEQNNGSTIPELKRPYLLGSPIAVVDPDPIKMTAQQMTETGPVSQVVADVALFQDWYDKSRFELITTTISVRIKIVDIYLSSNEPWKLAKSDGPAAKQKISEILYVAAEAIRIITILLHPILPYATTRVWQQLGLDKTQLITENGQLTTLTWGGLKPGTKLGPLGPIFPRADKGLAQIMTDMENPTPADVFLADPAADPRTTTIPAPATAFTTTPDPTPVPLTTENGELTTPQITIDDFAKIELRVAQILVAERIPKADKLLRLEVDLGPHGQRQILSGIAEFYTPEELIGRRIVVITNLAPRKMRGLESHGMLLAASDPEAGDHGKPHLATCGEEIALGARLK